MNLNPFNPAYRKYAVVVAAALLAALNALVPIVPAMDKPWVDLGILVLTALGVNQVRNAPLPVSSPAVKPLKV